MKKLAFYCSTLLLLSVRCIAGPTDTSHVLSNLAGVLKNLRNMAYDYTMQTEFPNGDRDHLKGVVFMNSENKIYYNDCDAFTMIYTAHWLYKANHRNKTVSVLNLDKAANLKLKNATERDIFGSNAISSFLDSTVVKKARIRAMETVGDKLNLVLGFPPKENVQVIDMQLDNVTNRPVKYSMTVHHLWQRSAKGAQVIVTKIDCSGFKVPDEQSAFSEQHFFVSNNGKIELKKYKNYKLSVKM